MHPSIAGVKDEHGVYLSRRSAAYPQRACRSFCDKKISASHSLGYTSFLVKCFQSISHQEDFSKPQGICGWGRACFRRQTGPNHPTTPLTCLGSVRDHWIPRILNNNWHKMIISHFCKRNRSSFFGRDH